MRTYVRGNCLPIQAQAALSQTELKKYWLVDANGLPIGKPFNRRWEVEAYEQTAGGEHQIITQPRGKPRKYTTEQERKAVYDHKRQANPKRRKYKAEWIKNKRKQSKQD